jgi:hypothetical protein
MKKKIHRRILVAAWMVLLPCAAAAQEGLFDESSLGKNGRSAYQTLLKVKLFAIGGIGYSGDTSDGERAFDILLEERDALTAFKSLTEKATIEGGMYGLLGLKLNECDCFEKEREDFRKTRTSETNAEVFRIQFGCEYSAAETNNDKHLAFDLVFEGFEQFMQIKLKQRQYRKNL